MKQPSPLIDSQREKHAMGIEALDSVNGISSEEIDDLRRLIKPEFQQTFDNLPTDGKLTLAALNRMGVSRLIELGRGFKGMNGIHILGVHDLRDRLNFILHAVPELEERWESEK